MLIHSYAKLAEKILGDRYTNKTLIEGLLILRLRVADEGPELLLEGQVQSSHLDIDQLIQLRQGASVATGPLLPSPGLLRRLEFLGQPRCLSSLAPHLIHRLLIVS